MQKNNVLKEIEKITKGDDAEIKKLVEIFIRQTSEKLTQLNHFSQSNNWQGIKQTAHFLKSNFLILKIHNAAKLTDFLLKNAGLKEEETKKHIRELVHICQQIIAGLTEI